MTDRGLVHDITALRKLIAENPDLPIVVLASDTANTGDFGWMYCENVSFKIGEVLDCDLPFDSEYVFTDRDEFEEALADYLCDVPEAENLLGAEFDKFVDDELAEYEPYWKKVIEICASNG